MKPTILKILILLVNILYLPIKFFSIKNKITFITRQSNNLSVDMSMVKTYIDDTDDIITVSLSKELDKSLIGCIKYSGHFIRQMYHIATSKVVIIDGYCVAVSILKHKEETVFVQLWHALGAIKKFGYQTIGKKSGTKPEIAKAMKMHKNYDYILAASEATAKHFSEAFGYPEDKIVQLGLPRIDLLKNYKEDKAEEIITKYGLGRDKEVILYIPTFRKDQLIPLDKLIGNINLKDRIFVVKLHPLDNSKVSYELSKLDNVIIDQTYSSYDWLNVADRIITDYSALAIEGTLAGIPMYFYAYDYDEYSNDPGFNIDMKAEFGRYLCEDAEALNEIMNEEYDFSIIESFRKKYITVDCNGCTRKVAEFIVDLVN